MMRGILERLVLSMLEERPRTARALSDALPFRHRLTAKQLGSMLDSDRLTSSRRPVREPVTVVRTR